MGTGELLARAKQLTRNLALETLEDGFVFITWERARKHLGEVVYFEAATRRAALQHVICVEEEALLRRYHGPDCPCEDCCIARVDLERCR